MNIIIEMNAADYIRKHSTDNSVTLFVKSQGAGWCSLQSPTVQLGKPQPHYEEKFDLYKIDDISVYIRKQTQVDNNGIHIFTRSFFGIKELVVDGIRIN